VTDWIGAAEAAQRLGIKQASLYSYVSRGVLTRRTGPDGRASLFDPGEVETLVRRARPRRVPGAAELIIETSLTEIAGDRLWYRGHDATVLAASRTFEEVAGLLWTGSFGDAAAPWGATSEAIAVGTAAQAALPAGTLPLERLQVIVPAHAATDPLRLQLDPPAVIAAARGLIAGLVDCLPVAAGSGAVAGRRPGAGTSAGLVAEAGASAGSGAVAGRRPGAGTSAGLVAEAGASAGASAGLVAEAGASADPGLAAGSIATGASTATGGPTAAAGSAAAAGQSIAERLAAGLCPSPDRPGLTAVLQAALVLLADHELAASTLAARVAASVRADPYAVVATGLGAVGGALHGGASLGAELMLASANEPADAPRVVGELLRRGERIPGFGHFVYETDDPRSVKLLSMIRDFAPDSVRLAVADAVLAEASRRALPEPNIDFALAALVDVAGLIRGAGEAVFAVARCAGWLAHALEEYARRTPIRPRGIYTGPPRDSA
jgi:citrate synthase